MTEETFTKCGKNPGMHTTFKNGKKELKCCACHIKEGYAPADWHPECMKEYIKKGKIK